jgi:16S rRNA processing protein RimM
MVVLGRLRSAHGLKGEIKVDSYTDPPEGILGYPVWHLKTGAGMKPVRVLSGRSPNGRVQVLLEGIASPEAARPFAGLEVAVPRDALPPTGPKEYYWEDLTGLSVRTRAGRLLGRVSHFLDLPAQPVMVVKGEGTEFLLPLRPEVLNRVDLARGEIEVDWDVEA